MDISLTHQYIQLDLSLANQSKNQSITVEDSGVNLDIELPQTTSKDNDLE